MEILSKTKLNFKILILIFACLFAFGLCFGFIGFPNLMEYIIKKDIRLLPGSSTRDMYLNIPFPLTFNVYLFNITNPEEVQKGEMPILHEVGPYVFE